MKKLLLVALLLLSGCDNNAMDAKISSFNRDGHITCYSGGVIIFEADSKGKINSERETDGWYFEDKETGQLVRVSGECVIKN